MDSYRNATGINIMRPFRKRSKELMRGLRPAVLVWRFRSPHHYGREFAMPAYAQPRYLQSHDAPLHGTVEMPPVICPDCVGVLPMVMRNVEPHWTGAKIDFIYECSDCGSEVRDTLTKPH
jgi:hypothetical protein